MSHDERIEAAAEAIHNCEYGHGAWARLTKPSSLGVMALMRAQASLAAADRLAPDTAPDVSAFLAEFEPSETHKICECYADHICIYHQASALVRRLAPDTAAALGEDDAKFLDQVATMVSRNDGDPPNSEGIMALKLRAIAATIRKAGPA